VPSGMVAYPGPRQVAVARSTSVTSAGFSLHGSIPMRNAAFSIMMMFLSGLVGGTVVEPMTKSAAPGAEQLAEEERKFRERQLELQDADIAQRALEAEKTQKYNEKQLNYTRFSLAITLISVLLATAISSLAIKTSLDSSEEANRNNTEQFAANSRMTYFKNIVDGLASNSAAVQVTSMRLLTEYVNDSTNYEGNAGKQRDGARDALQTLSAFVQDKSADRSKGLPDYRVDIPLIVDRAVSQMDSIASNRAFGSPIIDMNEADLHGRYMVDFAPSGKLSAPGIDLRRGTLTNMDLTSAEADLSGGFFTCAALQNAKFGAAYLQNADFTGADLAGADLRNVRDLHANQLHGANLQNAQLSDGLKQELASDVTTPWRTDSARCTNTVNQMTGMLAGQGYAETIPCPTSKETWPPEPSRLADQLQFRDEIIVVCASRNPS